MTPDPSGAARPPQTTDELVAQVRETLRDLGDAAFYSQARMAAKARYDAKAPEWLGALVQAVEDLREKLGRANEQNQYCHDNHSPGQQMVIESQTQQLHDIRLEVAQLRADGQRLREKVSQWRALAADIHFDAGRTDFDERYRLETKARQLEACALELEVVIARVGDAP